MGVDYTASLFFGARITEDEYNRIGTLEDGHDEWFAGFGLDYKGTDDIAFVEAGAAAYSGQGGEMFIASKRSVASFRRRDRATMSQMMEADAGAPDTRHEALVRRFVMDYEIPVGDVGWFLTMRVS